MLKIKNLTKIYKPKKGASVLALDNVSFELAETGMVFLLGKSGSGKSTLLNLIGGLDSYTSGEVVIKGKSSQDFKPSDFDSYRSTFIGFVFQEFNMLEDYSVGKNIALALELQQQKPVRADIETLMAQVDLEKEHYDRKIGELSGGQKQRVAIARAIVKNPDIIMADEPTGALDSKTGEQVFATLKKLSKERLVIVVSHDRDSAEKYGDRIIELADGVIIDDKVAKNGAFVPTKQEDIHIKSYAKEDFRLVKSKLSFRDSLILGVSGLRQKKLRLFFTILLSVFAFMLFGVCATVAAYDQHNVEQKVAKDIGQRTILISSVLQLDEPFTGRDTGAGITQENIAKITSITGNKVLYLRQQERDSNIEFGHSLARLPKLSYYATYFSNFLEVDSEKSANLIPKADGSRLPSVHNYSEIAISDWVADSFVEYGLVKGDQVKEINKYEDLLGEKIQISNDYVNTELTITGVYQTDIDKDIYKTYLTKQKITEIDRSLLAARDDLILSMGFVSIGFATPTADSNDTILALRSWEYQLANSPHAVLFEIDKVQGLSPDEVYLGGRELSSLQQDEVIINPYLYNGMTDIDEVKNYFDNISAEDREIRLYRNRILVGTYKVAGVLTSKKWRQIIYVPDNIYNTVSSYINSSTELNIGNDLRIVHKDATLNPNQDAHVVWKASEYDLPSLNIYWGKHAQPKTKLASNEVIMSKGAVLGRQQNISWTEQNYKSTFDDMEKIGLFGPAIFVYHKEGYEVVNGKEVKIVGVFMDDMSFNNAHFVSDDIYSHISTVLSQPESVMINLTDNSRTNQKVFDYLKSLSVTQDGIISWIKPFTTATQLLDGVHGYAIFFVDIFWYASIVFSLFAALLLMNFIALSIQNKKKEIGILRAIGARSSDVFKIFATESLIIGIINFIASFLAVVAISAVVNSIFMAPFLIPGIVQAAMMAALSLLIAILATLIPTYKIAKKKPIDAIAGR